MNPINKKVMEELGCLEASLVVDLVPVTDVALGANRQTQKDSAGERLRLSKEKARMQE
jgi:hypothetical protein